MNLNKLIEEVFCIDEMAKSANPIFDSIKDKLKTYLKKEGIKYSIRTEYNVIRLSLLEGPIDFIGNYIENVTKTAERSYEPRRTLALNNLKDVEKNKYVQIHNVEKNDERFNGKALKIMFDIENIIKSQRYTVIQDVDYGNIPNYYVYIDIGSWDKPYKYTGK